MLCSVLATTGVYEPVPAMPALVTQQLRRGERMLNGDRTSRQGNLQSPRSVFMCFSGRAELCFAVSAQRCTEVGCNKGCCMAVTIKPLNSHEGARSPKPPCSPFPSNV